MSSPASLWLLVLLEPTRKKFRLLLKERFPARPRNVFKTPWRDKGNAVASIIPPLAVVSEPDLVPEQRQACVVVNPQPLDVAPSASVWSEEFASVENRLNNLLG